MPAIEIQSNEAVNAMEQGTSAPVPLAQQTDVVSRSSVAECFSRVGKSLLAGMGLLQVEGFYPGFPEHWDVAADYTGEKVADCLGITSSRYQFYVDEADYQAQEDQEQQQAMRTAENAQVLSKLP